jgi:hypothetical protein
MKASILLALKLSITKTTTYGGAIGLRHGASVFKAQG